MSSNLLWMCAFGRFATDVMFQARNGDRSNVPNYLVIMTDGNSDNSTATWIEATRARARGINIIIVSNSAHSCFCLPLLTQISTGVVRSRRSRPNFARKQCYRRENSALPL